MILVKNSSSYHAGPYSPRGPK